MKSNQSQSIAQAFACFALLACMACESSGKVRGTTLAPSASGKLAIGYFENRHTGYRSFPVKNFVDMLEFEFMDQGYEVLEYSPALLEKPQPQKPPATCSDSGPHATEADPLLSVEPPSFSRSDGTSDLFPRNLRDIAGERGSKRRKKVRPRFLSAGDIQRLSETLPFDYFIQGAVGTTERNLFAGAFDNEEDSLIFLKVYDRTGRRIGTIRFFVDEKDYSQASFLTKISVRIVENFRASINRSDAVEATAPAASGTQTTGQDSDTEPAQDPAPVETPFANEAVTAQKYTNERRQLPLRHGETVSSRCSIRCSSTRGSVSSFRSPF